MMEGKLFGLGVGPGDPELITLKALKRLQAAPVVAYFAARNAKGNAFSTIEAHLAPEQELLRLDYPVTRATLNETEDYESLPKGFYDRSAEAVAAHLDQGRDVAVVCEGDPLFYGSYMYLHDRLAGRYETEVVPGISSIFASASVLGLPLVYRDQTLSVISATLAPEALRQRRSGEDVGPDPLVCVALGLVLVARHQHAGGHGEHAEDAESKAHVGAPEPGGVGPERSIGECGHEQSFPGRGPRR